jgi:hypothetical protein
MKPAFIALAAAAALAAGTAHAAEQGNFGRLDHVFLIIMENQTNTDILGNPNAPFINSYATVAKSGDQLLRGRAPERPQLSRDRRRLEFRADRRLLAELGQWRLRR